MTFNRSRWAALGAAVAVTLGAGGMVGVNAAVGSGERTVFVPITPCRIFDTRPDTQIGVRSAPLGPNDTHTVTGRGETGDCEIPTDATGLVLNVTAVGATQLTFLTIYPADASERPDASSLNPDAGAPPTPNAVTTDLSATGEFSIYNAYGSVHILADVVGYYADHNHDDRYYTKAEIDAGSAGDVIAMGFYSSTTKTIAELRTRDGVTVTVVPSATGGRVGLRIAGADTADVPIVLVMAHSSDQQASCNRSLLTTSSDTVYTATIDCHNAAGTGLDRPFQFVVFD